MNLEFSDKQNEYIVYVHTNKVNGKRYFGITRQKPERRWQKGFGYADTYFGNAINKYGWDNFEHEVIADGLSKEEACKMEIELIAKHKTNEREHGYNIAKGGQTCDVITGRCGEKHPNHQRVKMIDPVTKKVLRVFGAQAEAAQEMGISRKGITKACVGEGCVTYKGYIWEYADKKYEKPKAVGVGNYKHTKIQKVVYMTDTDGTTHTFRSVNEAGEKMGIIPNTVSRYASGIRKDGTGRRWSYAP